MSEFTHRFEYNAYGERILIERNQEDLTAEVLVDTFVDFMLAIGYHPDTIAEYIYADESWYGRMKTCIQ